MQISARAVDSPSQLRQFIEFPLTLYRDDPLFVPHLTFERREFFSPKNPIFKFTDVAYFLASDPAGEVVGRITAHVNRRHNQFVGERTGFFGFFESIPDLRVARALTGAAEQWLRRRGMDAIRGPFNFSTNDECGFLARGFETPPVFMMPHTRPYYLDFMRDLGYERAKDLLAFHYEWQGAVPERFARLARRVEERTSIRVREMDTSRFEQEVATAFEIYNSAWERNWGFVPMTREEFRHLAKGLKPLVDPAVALVAQQGGRPIGFSLGLPDYNVLLRRMRGRLLPWGPLLYLFGRRTIHKIRVLTLGVLKEYRNHGVDVLLCYYIFKKGVARGYTSWEMSWILEDNVQMIRPMERSGAVAYKTYRIFEKRL